MLNVIKTDLAKLGVFHDKKITFIRIVLGYFGSKCAQSVILFRLANYFGKKSNLLGYLIANHCIKETGCDIKHKAKIDKGFHIKHTVGVVISGGAKIGKNFSIYQCATIGTRGGSHIGNDNLIGDNVTVLSGAKVLCKKVGNNVIIGANSVVLYNVPSNCTIVGNPAKIVRLNGKQVNISLEKYNKCNQIMA